MILGLLVFLAGSAQAIPTPVNPLYNLTRFNGEPVKLGLLNQPGERVLVYVWATWCTSCEEKLVSILPKWKARPGLQILAVNTDRDLEKAKDYAGKRNLALDLVRDDRRTLLKELKAFAVPSWAVYKRTGDGQWALVETAGGFEESRVLAALER
jgi:thiol-disulfide isomerase/thioredoxin